MIQSQGKPMTTANLNRAMQLLYENGDSTAALNLTGDDQPPTPVRRNSGRAQGPARNDTPTADGVTDLPSPPPPNPPQLSNSRTQSEARAANEPPMDRVNGTPNYQARRGTVNGANVIDEDNPGQTFSANGGISRGSQTVQAPTEDEQNSPGTARDAFTGVGVGSLAAVPALAMLPAAAGAGAAAGAPAIGSQLADLGITLAPQAARTVAPQLAAPAAAIEGPAAVGALAAPASRLAAPAARIVGPQAAAEAPAAANAPAVINVPARNSSQLSRGYDAANNIVRPGFSEPIPPAAMSGARPGNGNRGGGMLQRALARNAASAARR